MREPRIENLVSELKTSIDRSNKILKILEQRNVKARILAINNSIEIVDIVQEVEYK